MTDLAATEAYRVVSFINTLHRPDGDDVLADKRAAGWLADWLGSDIAGAGGRIDNGSLIGLQTLREGLRQLAAANNGQPPDPQVLAGAATVLRSAPLVVELGDHRQQPRLLAPVSDASVRSIAAVAGHYLNLRASDAWSRVKACAADDCRWAYLDTSRNRSRRWCDMADCGNRAKSRTWRARHRSTDQEEDAAARSVGPSGSDAALNGWKRSTGTAGDAALVD